MRVEVKVPQLPESVAEATLVSWHKKAGEAVKRDENLIDIETDKVVLELPAPADGVLVEVLKGDGTTVTSNDVIAVLDTDGQGCGCSAAARSAAGSARTMRRARPPRSNSPRPRRRSRSGSRVAGRRVECEASRRRAARGSQADGRAGCCRAAT